MPWKALTMSEARTAFVALALSPATTVAAACRQFGISRKTGYKWLARHAADPDAALDDRSRRPLSSPGRTADDVEARILAARDQYGWGGRKLRALLRAEGLGVPSGRTVTEVLRRHGRTARPTPEPAAVQRFERGAPNELWQLDFKGPVEVARRRLPVFTTV